MERRDFVEPHSRIQLSLAFSVPDYTLRMDIWKSHVPGEIGDIWLPSPFAAFPVCVYMYHVCVCVCVCLSVCTSVSVQLPLWAQMWTGLLSPSRMSSPVG